MNFSDPFRVRWELWRQRPFWRLVELFVARIFRGAGDSDSEGLDVGVGLVLTLLAAPGGFVNRGVALTQQSGHHERLWSKSAHDKLSVSKCSAVELGLARSVSEN